MKTTIDYITQELQSYYPSYETDSIIKIMMEYILKKQYTPLLKETQLSDPQKSQIENIVKRLQSFEPIQHILGKTEFFGLPILVNKNVLIPRPETEELVELILQSHSNNLEFNILDIGTGSGAIAIALKQKFKKANVEAWDISSLALDTAQQNAILNKVDIKFKEKNILSDITTIELSKLGSSYDIIVSNPPYVLESEKKDMHRNVLDYDPHIALFVPDDNPLLFYKKIALLGLDLLKSGGSLYFEINRLYGNETKQMLENLGYLDANIKQDISRNDRILRAKKQ